MLKGIAMPKKYARIRYVLFFFDRNVFELTTRD